MQKIFCFCVSSSNKKHCATEAKAKNTLPVYQCIHRSADPGIDLKVKFNGEGFRDLNKSSFIDSICGCPAESTSK